MLWISELYCYSEGSKVKRGFLCLFLSNVCVFVFVCVLCVYVCVYVFV